MNCVFILATFAFVAVNCNSIRRISHSPQNETKTNLGHNHQNKTKIVLGHSLHNQTKTDLGHSLHGHGLQNKPKTDLDHSLHKQPKTDLGDSLHGHSLHKQPKTDLGDSHETKIVLGHALEIKPKTGLGHGLQHKTKSVLGHGLQNKTKSVLEKKEKNDLKNKTKNVLEKNEKTELIREIASELIKQMPKPVNVQVVNIDTCCNGTKKDDWMKKLMKQINNAQGPTEPKPKRKPKIPKDKKTNEIPGPTTEAPKNEAPIKCKEPDAKFDICLLLDESGSVGEVNYEKEKKFLANFVNEFDVGPNKTRFCLIEFSDQAVNRMRLEDSASKDQVKQTILSQSYEGATTNIFAALEAGHQELKDNKREGVPQLVVLLTDGEHNMEGNPVEAAEAIKNDGIHIFSVGVTDSIDKDQLEEIAGSKDRLMVVDDFDQLVKNVNKIIKSLCSD